MDTCLHNRANVRRDGHAVRGAIAGVIRWGELPAKVTQSFARLHVWLPVAVLWTHILVATIARLNTVNPDGPYGRPNNAP